MKVALVLNVDLEEFKDDMDFETERGGGFVEENAGIEVPASWGEMTDEQKWEWCACEMAYYTLRHGLFREYVKYVESEVEG